MSCSDYCDHYYRVSRDEKQKSIIERYLTPLDHGVEVEFSADWCLLRQSISEVV